MNTPGEAETAYYVYGVAQTRNGNRGEASPSVDLGCSPVYGLRYRDLIAVVGPVSLAEFGPEVLDANLHDVDWVRRKVLAHQEVLAGLLGRYTHIPIKFGALYRSEASLREMLEQYYHHLAENLARVEGATEWGVKLYCNRSVLMQWIRERNEQVRQMEEEASQRSEGAAYFLRKKLEQRVWQEMDLVVDARVRESHRRLAGLTREAVINPVQPAEVNGRRGEMLLNGAYLVDDRSRETFRAAVAALEEVSAPHGFGYEQTGPWPPYNFVTVVSEEASGDPAGT